MVQRQHVSQPAFLSGDRVDIKACLLECNRVLSTGGYFEYIYFESDLSNPGPLTAQLEEYLGQSWSSRGGDLMVCDSLMWKYKACSLHIVAITNKSNANNEESCTMMSVV